MEWLFILIISIVPGALWVYYFYAQDRYNKEPVRLIIGTFILGMLAVIPAILWESPFKQMLSEPSDLLTRLFTAFFVVGFGEELFKLLPVYLFVFRHAEFDEPVDGIIYAVTASLGFASLENALYTAVFGYGVAPIRALVTTAAHASFGGVAGLHLGIAKFHTEYGGGYIFRGLLIASFLHGLYDFLVIGDVVHPFVALLIIVVSFRFVIGSIREFVERGTAKHRRE